MTVVVINVYVCVRSRDQLIITLTPLPRYFDASDPRGESRSADANNHLCGFYSVFMEAPTSSPLCLQYKLAFVLKI